MADHRRLFLGATALVAGVVSCSRVEPADLLLVNGRVYTLSWGEPDADGRPASNAPHDANGWRPDAEAIAVRAGRIVFVGSRTNANRFRGSQTTVRDLGGATVLPGLIDSHVHLENLGASLERVNLVGVKTEAEAVARVAERAAATPKGTWIIGWGWDEGAWASRYPDSRMLSQRVPDHPVLLHGLHGFASWSNRAAFERAAITAATAAPVGGEIRKDKSGHPTGILLNNASRLVERAVPPATPAQLEARIARAFTALGEAGYVHVQEAGANSAIMSALEKLSAARKLPLRVDAMLAARDPALLDVWEKRGPDTDGRDGLVTRSVKAFYDGAMGSRGAFFLDDYADQPGHQGVGGAAYGFDRDRMATMMKAGFQLIVHAIGDRANRETLDLIESVEEAAPPTAQSRPRIEHAQVVALSDMARFSSLGVIASMQPAHAVEDMPWAETRIGPERIKGAYAWRSLRQAGARLVFNSDLPATDYNIFYGLHSAVTRQDRELKPAGGWRANERMTIEEAVRGWTTWAAYATFREAEAGMLAAGRAADLTVLDIDPFVTADKEPARLLSGRINLTMVEGRILYDGARATTTRK
jgi:predicted amidohydrolase YtcJ